MIDMVMSDGHVVVERKLWVGASVSSTSSSSSSSATAATSESETCHSKASSIDPRSYHEPSVPSNFKSASESELSESYFESESDSDSSIESSFSFSLEAVQRSAATLASLAQTVTDIRHRVYQRVITGVSFPFV